MRKIFLIFIVLIFILSAVNSASMYLGPYYAITNINLNNPNWSSLRPTSGTLLGRPAHEVSDGIYQTNPNGTAQVFDDLQIIALGALYQIPYKSAVLERNQLRAAKNYGVKISAESSSYDGNYFWFTSQSNPDSRRPFLLQASVSYWQEGRNEIKITDALGNNDGLLRGDNDSVSLWQSDAKEINDDWFMGWTGIGEVSEEHLYSIIIDVGIILPGTIVNGVLTLENGERYVLSSADDYSAEISITLELISKDGAPIPPENSGVNRMDWDGSPISITLSLPLSGFYDPTLDDSKYYADATSSLDIKTSAKASNVDLLADQNHDFKIADLEYSIYNIKNNAPAYDADGNPSDPLDSEDIFLFLSASPNPFAENEDGFLFVHEESDPSQKPGPEESLGYYLYFKPSGDLNSSLSHGSGNIPLEATFDGTDFLDEGGNPQNRVGTVCFTENLDHTKEKAYRHWHSYNGEIWMHLNTSEVNPMNSGYYKSYVYVHAIVDFDAV